MQIQSLLATNMQRRMLVVSFSSKLKRASTFLIDASAKRKEKKRALPYLELHHRVLAEFVSTGGSDLVQADELGLVADAIALKTPDESRLAAILPCRHTYTHTLQSTVHLPVKDLHLPQTSAITLGSSITKDFNSNLNKKNPTTIVQVKATDVSNILLCD